jgi:hypothetical protein
MATSMSRSRVSPSVAIAMCCATVFPAAAADLDGSEGDAFDAAVTEADKRFVAGDLSGALEVLEPVCARSESATCSFSLGAIHHGLGHCHEALVHYRHYRAVAPRGEHSAEVEAALEEVEGRCGASGPAAPASTPSPAASSPAVPSLPPSAPAADPIPPVMVMPPAATDNSIQKGLVIGSFAVSGAAAASSIVFGVLAARSARHCERARAYDRDYIQECEVDGPRYQSLWQGFALASGGFLGVGLALWWLDGSSSAALGVSGVGTPALNYRRSF